jgi:hypothetical protein
VLVAIAVRVAGAAAPGAAVDAVPPQLQSFFPIGVWVPPDYSYSEWKGRGANTMVGIDFDMAGSIATADSLGLHMIREPQPNPADDANEALLLAWAQPDEPDGIYSQVPYTTIQTTYNTWKGIAPNRPVFINFVGDLNQYDLVTGESGNAWYEKYVQGADWICADKYPVNEGITDLSVMGATMDHLQILAGNKPIFAFIESSDIDTTDGNPGPSPGQLRAEMWEVIIHGARGIWFFPEQITPTFLSDTTPANVVAEMTAQNATITALASVLQGAVNPAEISASVASPLDVGWRDTPGAAYLLALNLSGSTHNARTLTLGGVDFAATASVYGESRSVAISGNTITDNFAPYALHIYVALRDEIFANGFE